jgi:hypothetical protein
MGNGNANVGQAAPQHQPQGPQPIGYSRYGRPRYAPGSNRVPFGR